MSYLPIDARMVFQPRDVARHASLWTAGRPARILRSDGEFAAQLLELDRFGATVVAACVFSLGETIILTINGVGHIPARVIDRACRGVRVVFDTDADLSRAIARVLDKPAPQMII